MRRYRKVVYSLTLALCMIRVVDDTTVGPKTKAEGFSDVCIYLCRIGCARQLAAEGKNLSTLLPTKTTNLLESTILLSMKYL